jgi:hypothetical protein
MSLTRLTKKIKALHEYESEKGSFEANALKVLSLSKAPLNEQKVEDLILLADSIKPLRKLLHRQIKELLLDLQMQMKGGKKTTSTREKKTEKLNHSSSTSKSSSSEQLSPNSEALSLQEASTEDLKLTESEVKEVKIEASPQSKSSPQASEPLPVKHSNTSELESSVKSPSPVKQKSSSDSNSYEQVKPRLEQNPQTPQPLKITEAPMAFNSEKPSAPPQDASSNQIFEVDQTPDIAEFKREATQDALEIGSPLADIDSKGELNDPDELDELEALKREVEFLTTPNFAEDAVLPDDLVPTLQSSAELPFDLPPLPTLEPSFFQDSSASIDANITNESTDDHTDSQPKAVEVNEKAISSSASEPFEFPMSAGEAGTAVFDEEALKKFQEQDAKLRAQSEASSLHATSQKTASFSVHVSTPQQVFVGHADQFDHKELVLICQQGLLRGEEVKLKFKLPQSQEMIECKALVRLAENTESMQKRLILRFLDLRPLQIDQIKAEA